MTPDERSGPRHERPAQRSLSRRSLLTHGGAAGVGGLVAATGALLTTRDDPARADGVPRADGGTELRTPVTVGGADGHFGALDEVFAAFPAGGVDILVRAGELRLPDTLEVSGVTNVTIRGEGREASRIVCDRGFVLATSDSDGWTIRDLEIRHVDGPNTDSGIVVDYPRRWSVEATTLRFFGGSAIRLRGGLHSQIARNYIFAEDSTGENGFAGIHVDATDDGLVATTIQTYANFVYGGRGYGLYLERADIGCLFMGDIAEHCAVGFRLVRCTGELHSPYTEENGVGIELEDCADLIVVGRLRDEPVVSWSGEEPANRNIVRIGSRALSPGGAIVYSGAAGDVDPVRAPSIRWGVGDPEGVVPGVVGSEWNRTDGGPGSTKYIKERGSGATGWRAL